MRVKLILMPFSQTAILPINYNYLLTSLIYKIIKNSSEDYSQFLHDKGYRMGNSKKGFKLFTYSMLISDNLMVKRERIVFQEEVQWHVSSPVNDFMQHLITGVFAEGQEIKIGTAGNEVKFIITRVEALSVPEFKKTMHFTCLSPVTISKISFSSFNRSNSSSGWTGSTCHYLRPWEEGFSEAIKKNLTKKYKLVTGKDIDDTDFKITIDTEYMNRKNGKITKNINFKGINIIGFMAPFEVTGNPELIKIGYEAGFGEKGSMGFGMVKKIE